VIILLKDELDSFVRPDVVNSVTAEIIHLMVQKSLILREAREILKEVERRFDLVKFSIPE